MELRELEERIKNCTRCPLHKNRTQAVPGYGGFRKKVMLIGEAPGKNEDLEGKPFVGRAGKLLDELLMEIGLSREDVYITNVVKCRPPNNRDPTEEEINACSPYLEAQISLLSPHIIMTLGRFSWAWVCEKYGIEWRKLSEARGNIYSISTLYSSFYVIPTYHPAAVLRRKELLEEIKEDFHTLKNLLGKIHS